MNRKRYALLVVMMITALSLFAYATTPAPQQLGQSGGASGGANASVGTKAAAAPASASLAGGEFNTSLPTYTNGQMGALQLDASGRLLVASIAGSLPSGANTIGAVNIAASQTIGLAAGANVVGTVKSVVANSCGSTVYDSGGVTLPLSATSLTATHTCVETIYLNNTTGATQTVTITDGQATPFAYLSAFQIPANSTLRLDFDGARFNTGIKWQAGNASAVNAHVKGYQAP